MTIDLKISVNEKKILTSYNDENVTLLEVSMIITELEKIKKELLNLEFDREFEYNKEAG